MQPLFKQFQDDFGAAGEVISSGFGKVGLNLSARAIFCFVVFLTGLSSNAETISQGYQLFTDSYVGDFEKFVILSFAVVILNAEFLRGGDMSEWQD